MSSPQDASSNASSSHSSSSLESTYACGTEDERAQLEGLNGVKSNLAKLQLLMDLPPRLQACVEAKQYEEAVRHAMVEMERESKETSSKAQNSKVHREALQAQIDAAAEYRSRHVNDKYEEGRRLKQEFASERAKLETIRDKMVSDMKLKGVNPKYLTEMMSADIQKMQMR